MFNKRFLSVLSKFSGAVIFLGAAIFSVSGFFIAVGHGGSAAEQAGYLLGYEASGLAVFAMMYLILGCLARWNEAN